MVFTLPLPGRITQYYPTHAVIILQWFAFWAFAGLLTVPWLFCVFQLVTNIVGRKKRIHHILDEFSAPKVVIVMPCYREKPEVLLRTIDSIVDCEYPPSCMHVFLSFDGDEENELYLNTIDKLGVPLTMKTYPKSIDVVYRNCRVTVSRFPHGGKRGCQKRTFKLIDKVYEEYLKRNDNLFILFIDSDCILDKVCIQNFMYEMELKPGSKRNMLAMTGVITSTTDKNNLLTVLQDMEYIHGQLFERSVESGCGAVTCLPGALTVLRFSAFRKISKEYFKDRTGQIEDIFDYGKSHLGEDRYLTHLFMIAAKERYQIQMNTGAFCKTEAVLDWKSLLKQRRRWFLGFLTNEVCMITDIRLWKRYPLLLLVRFCQNTIRTTALLFFIMVISLMTTSQRVQNLPVGFIAVSLGLNWALMLYFGAILGRYKIMLYPIMFIVNPAFNWCYMVYGIFTAGQRTWGGPRADATKADDKKTPAEAIAEAEEGGDDLNVAPETFKATVMRKKSQRGERYEPMALQPGSDVEGRFTAAQPIGGGWYEHENTSMMTLPGNFRRAPGGRPMTIHPRDSTDSFASMGTSVNNSIYVPRRIESFMSPEETQMYHQNQDQILNDKPAGGDALAIPRHRPGFMPGPGPVAMKPTFKDSVESIDSHQSIRPYTDRNVSGYSSGGSSPARPSSPQTGSPHSPTGGELSGALQPPVPASLRVGGDRNSSASHSSQHHHGRSPLARESYLRSAEDLSAMNRPEMADQRLPLNDPRSRSPGPAEEPYFPPRDDAADSGDEGKKRRKRLTKDKWSDKKGSR
jgi:chitin synthase